MSVLEAKAVTKRYPIEERLIPVLDQVTFSVEDGEFLVIQGSSGSGKSTLLSLLSGLDNPSEGQILIDDTDVTGWSEDDLAPLRNQVFGFVFQSFHLVPSLSALENVMFPAELSGDRRAREKATLLLQRVGLEARHSNFPHQLSGGEKQRVAICRALINEPRILFADEPTGNLDSSNGQAILDLLTDLHRERRMTLVLVTHSPQVAELAERVITLADGRIVSDLRAGESA